MILLLCHADGPKRVALHGLRGPSLPASSRAQLKDMSCDRTHQYWLSIQVKRSYLSREEKPTKAGQKAKRNGPYVNYPDRYLSTVSAVALSGEVTPLTGEY